MSSEDRRVWNFLLPGEGEHQVSVVNIGKADQRVYLDGSILEAPPDTFMFTGPAGHLLELRKISNAWRLLVGGLIVEEYRANASASESLRDVRHMPEGSYTIATHFEADSLLTFVRKYRFLVHGECHEIGLAHANWAWQVVFNGIILHHSASLASTVFDSAHLQVNVGRGQALDARISMQWQSLRMIWVYTLTVNGTAVPACWTKRTGDIDEVQLPEVCSPDVLNWWRFSVPGAGTHHVRVKNPGTPERQLFVDGAPIPAAADTTVFTGPSGTLLELKNHISNVWELYVDGEQAEVYIPGDAVSPSVHWWKFSPPTIMGVHKLRVTNIGTDMQEVVLDGIPLDAPPSTMDFTGPGGVLLQLQRGLGGCGWQLKMDGHTVSPYDPKVESAAPPLTWRFPVAATGQVHEFRVLHIGQSSQEFILDGATVMAPEGCLSLTGPGGTLLVLQDRGEGSWMLLVDGQAVEPALPGELASVGAAPPPERTTWVFIMPDMSAHEMQVNFIGGSAQEVYIDGAFVEAPAGTVMFTGPAGVLLELRTVDGSWQLYVDGLLCEQFSARSSTAAAVANHGGVSSPAIADDGRGGNRQVVSSESGLPQGVSFDSESRAYQANLRVRGKFMFLGEFATVEEAHAKYLEAKQRFG